MWEEPCAAPSGLLFCSTAPGGARRGCFPCGDIHRRETHAANCIQLHLELKPDNSQSPHLKLKLPPCNILTLAAFSPEGTLWVSAPTKKSWYKGQNSTKEKKISCGRTKTQISHLLCINYKGSAYSPLQQTLLVTWLTVQSLDQPRAPFRCNTWLPWTHTHYIL